MGAEVFLFPMQKTGFTLIELMVVIAIIALLSILSYAPYNYYANIAKVRFSAEKIEQVVNEARASVLGWYSLSGTIQGNVHIWLVFSGGSSVIQMRGYPHTSGTGEIDSNTGQLIREIQLENNVNLDEGTRGIALFLSPNWELWTDSWSGFKKEEPFLIGVSYKKADKTSPLYKTVTIK